MCLERAYLLEFTRLEGNLILKICQKFTPGSVDHKSRDFIRAKNIAQVPIDHSISGSIYSFTIYNGPQYSSDSGPPPIFN